MSTTLEAIRNGVDTEQLFGTLDAIKADPTLARFQFRARNRWIDGAHNRTTIRDFYAANQEGISRAAEFVLDGALERDLRDSARSWNRLEQGSPIAVPSAYLESVGLRGGQEMNLITRDELRAKLDRGDEFKLVMTLSEFAYRAKHIPTSLHFEPVKETLGALNPGEEIVVYCADVHCSASIYAYYLLERAGYGRVRRYAGGIADLEAAGYPFEHGTPVAKTDQSGMERVPPRTTKDSRGTSSRWSRPCSCSS